jgi:hypothetical protein
MRRFCLSAVATTAATLALAGCADAPTGTVPAIMKASASPSSVAPGGILTVSYNLAVLPLKPIAMIELVGLPANAGPARLALPDNANLGQVLEYRVPVPAARGDYPLSLKLTTADGGVARQSLGTLTILDAPARLDSLSIEPASHSIKDCKGPTIRATLKYGIADDNGAADVGRIRLLPVESSSSGGALSVTPLVPPPDEWEDPIRVGAILNVSKRADVARDVVTTPVEIPCQLAAPARWTLKIVGIDEIKPTNTLAVEYATSP